MTPYTDHGKALSAERNSDRKPKLNERNRRTLKRIVSKNHRTAAAKVTANLNIHPEDPVSSQTVQRELHKSNIHGRAVIVKPLVTENKAKTRERYTAIISFSSLSYDRSKASSKASSPHSAIQSFLFQMRVSSPFLKVIQ